MILTVEEALRLARLARKDEWEALAQWLDLHAQDPIILNPLRKGEPADGG